MPELKVGPWRAEDYHSFIMLSTRAPEISSLQTRPTTLSGLLSLAGNFTDESRSRAEAEIVSEAWEVRLAHPIYRSLKRNPSFTAAWTVFDKARKNAKSEKLKSAFAPFEFLRVIVEQAGEMYQFRSLGRVNVPNKRRYGATAERRRRAAKRAGQLKELMANGIRLESYEDNRTLNTLLDRLVLQLASTPRKQYGGKREYERKILIDLAFSLIVSCDLRSPAVVGHFARLVNAPCDEKTAQRYTNQAAKKWRLLLARVLRDTDTKDALSK